MEKTLDELLDSILELTERQESQINQLLETLRPDVGYEEWVEIQARAAEDREMEYQIAKREHEAWIELAEQFAEMTESGEEMASSDWEYEVCERCNKNVRVTRYCQECLSDI